MTYTYAELEVPAEVYDCIAKLLIDAGYHHVFEVGMTAEAGKDCGPMDMHGVALTRKQPPRHLSMTADTGKISSRPKG